MDAFPAFFSLHGQTVVVAGTGEAAEAKARLFAGSPARLVRLEGHEAFLPGSYSGALLAFVAGDEAFATQAARAAKAARVLVNVVDRPKLSDFVTPAVIDRGEVVAAVGTGGSAPMLATLLRNDIEARVPEGAGRVAALLRKHQDQLRTALPDLAARRAFLRDVMAGPVAQAAMDGDAEKAARLLTEALAGARAPVGRVRFVAGRGPADLLTLRAVRALSAADVLIVETGADPHIVGMVRRDAERLAPDEAATARLVALAKGGRQVVRLITSAPDPKQLKALTDAGVAVEVLLAAPA